MEVLDPHDGGRRAGVRREVAAPRARDLDHPIPGRQRQDPRTDDNARAVGDGLRRPRGLLPRRTVPADPLGDRVGRRLAKLAREQLEERMLRSELRVRAATCPQDARGATALDELIGEARLPLSGRPDEEHEHRCAGVRAPFRVAHQAKLGGPTDEAQERPALGSPRAHQLPDGKRPNAFQIERADGPQLRLPGHGLLADRPDQHAARLGV